ncbi:MAG: hypothetical protein HYT16_00280 [DPANN group archaeon]|nr:hypothetical protein [DPANN group archaeon]
MKPHLFVLLLLAIGAVIVSQGLTNEIISSAASGSVKFFVVSSNNFFREDVQISNQTENTTVRTDFNVTFVFRTNTSSGGFLNVTKQAANPTQSQPLQKEAIGNFLEIQSNLSFANSTIIIGYDDSDVSGLDESSLRVYGVNNVSGNWDILPGAVNTSINEVTGLTTHFSTFGVFGGQSGTAVSAGFAGGGHTKSSAIVVTEAPLLDVLVEVVNGYKIIKPGKYILITVQLTNFGGPGRKDADVKYFIIDEGGNELPAGREAIAVETTASIVRKIAVSDTLPAGRYLVRVRAEADGTSAVGSASFQVTSEIGEPIARYFSARPATLLVFLFATFAAGIAAVSLWSHIKRDRVIKKFLDEYEKYWRRIKSSK